MTELKVTIRPLRIGDEPAVQRYASDERVARTTTIPEPYPEDGAARFVEQAVDARRNGAGFFFAIVADGEMIGVVELGGSDLESGSIQCDYAIASAYWGKGITTKAVSLALRYAFLELGMETVRSACLRRNPGSARVLEKNGFQETEGFVYNSSKFKGEAARQFLLTKKAWLASHANESDRRFPASVEGSHVL